MPITLDWRPKGRYPFEVFHTSMGSTFCTESELKSDVTVGDLPSLVPLLTSFYFWMPMSVNEISFWICFSLRYNNCKSVYYLVEYSQLHMSFYPLYNNNHSNQYQDYTSYSNLSDGTMTGRNIIWKRWI
jgi:hypothetical protein